jgi:hypothetical protein
MIARVLAAKHLGEHRIWLRFDDGAEGAIDLRNDLWGEIFEPLRDPAYFARFSVVDTLTWPNGADFAPEFLYERVVARTSGRSGSLTSPFRESGEDSA